MEQVKVHAAKSRLSELLARVEKGEEIVIARGHTPIAKLVPLQRKAPQRRFGSLEGLGYVDERFFEPLPEEELAAWE